MKSIIAAVVTCILLFGVSLGATYFLLPSPGEEDANSEVADASAEETPVEDEPSLQEMVSMPVSLRPDVSVESVLQMSDSIKKTEQQLMDREKDIEVQEQRLSALFDELTREEEELKAFSEGIDAKVDLLSRMNETLQRTLDDIDVKKAELEALRKDVGEDDATKQAETDSKVNAVKGWFSGLQPTQAADYLTEFSSNDIGFAATLLHKMPERQKAKILAEMNDGVLVQQLIDALRVQPKTK